jgi:hypothetical protein
VSKDVAHIAVMTIECSDFPARKRQNISVFDNNVTVATLCSAVEVHRRFGGTYHLHTNHQDDQGSSVRHLLQRNSYLTGDTLRLRYTAQPVNAI